ncbi:hypothetical protein ALC53_13699, partial [Atta colombica]
NSNYIEPQRFLEDASSVVLERVRDAVERYDSVKVNTAFNGKFATKDKRINKIYYIVTKNSEIYRYTDLREWYEQHIIQPILASPAKKYTERESSYPYYMTVLNLTDIEFPITFKDISKFERFNMVSINMYGIENKQVHPLRFTDDKKEKHVNLLYLQDSHNDNLGHFACIKNLLRLVSSQITKKNKKNYASFGSCEKLQLHEVNCQKINDCAIRLPSEDNKWLGNHCNKERVPFIIYADLKYILHKTESDKEDATSYAYQDTRVRDYCHLNCRYRGPTHSNCNLNYKNSFYIPIVFHNLSGYNAHFIIKEIATAYDGVKLRFIDSFKFLNRELFFSSLTGDTVSESDYANAVNVWQRFSIRMLGEYSDLLYLKTDVLLLADIFENFRNSCITSYCLDPAHKTMENVRNHVDVKLITKWDGRYGAEAMIAKPNFHSRSVFGKNLIAIEMRKLEVKFDKPIYVSMCILDISKVYLHEFHHEYMSPMYDDKRYVVPNSTETLSWGHWRIPL